MRWFLLFCAFFGVAAAPAGEHLLRAPHFTSKSGEWETTLTLQNPNSTSATVVIRAWSETGKLMSELTLNLQPFSGFTGNLRSLFDQLEEETGRLTLACNRDHIHGVVMFRNLVTGGEASVPLVEEAGRHLLLPLMENDDRRISGLVLSNTAEEQAELRITMRDLNGGRATTVTTTLAAQAKLKGILADLFDGELPRQVQLEVESTTPVTGFALTFQDGISQIITVPGNLWDPGRYPGLQHRLQQEFASIGLAGALAGIHVPGEDPVVAVAGLADIVTQRAMRPDAAADAGSITKTFTAALVFMLIQEGKLSLDDTLDTWIPDFPRAAEITVRMLLGHTSGIFDYTESETFFQDLVASFGQNQAITPEELLAYARDRPFVFEPGLGWSYSNTNYILLGMIIESVTGDQYVNQLRRRILVPLGLRRTYLAGSEPVPPDRARAYYNDGSGELLDVTEALDMSWLWAAGALISIPEDLMVFARALFEGELLQADSLQAMLTTTSPITPFSRYGLGVIINEVDGLELYGHDGGTFGGSAYFAYIPQLDTALATQLNHFAVNSKLGTLVRMLLNEAGIGAGDRRVVSRRSVFIETYSKKRRD
ncbi:MAG: serine hydrolase domain-containing protein [Acidobacteriota bacterium]|nr:serine hydrolase domain-containing protein [Acidobacteriota bacterium]